MSSGDPPRNRDELIAQLTSLAGIGAAEAEHYLQAGGWQLDTAATLYYDGATTLPQEHSDDHIDIDMAGDDQPTEPTPNPPQGTGGGRTLGGAYVPAEPSSSSAQPATSRHPPQRGMRTLKDLQTQGGAGAAGGHGHAHGDDGDHASDEDYQDDGNQDFFAGGEKSGLAVQNPNAANPRDQINNILRRARQNAPRPGGDDERPSSHFTGTGMTLGGDDAPSRVIPDPNAEAPHPPQRVNRELHLWRDGFSVDDGPLFRYDDPANARTLEMINSGHAPLHILNVEPGQEVDVEVHPHKDEDYKTPKKKYVPFSGSGQRLGSPTPGGTAIAAPPPPAAGTTTTTTTATASTSSAASPAAVDIDASAPTVTLQIRLGDGTRLQSRFNTTHTIGDVYGFVDAASAASTQRAYALMTTFPSTELTDKSKLLGDMAEFKRGGVVVQKWK
ncbi:SEP-domain-containing protein [Lindgomyces ingoldianus]|uniref:SEP-domain-containing protein n=1 Tax=Lindgomyces ingoldianus TaxID=673940 RepID=A0ACB6QNX1_9PLEO|nr:SEP-domain-containing protein [Lindgomyces ingoldianus]KAF2467797.1 SEP-domain-containing protein [Lindgomyces ingoldianus]